MLPKIFMNFATPAVVPTGDTGGGGATPSPSPAGGGGAPATPPPAAPAAAPVSGIDQLRREYENLKKEYEPYKALGNKPEEIGQFKGTYQAVFTEVAGIGRSLGYSDDEITEAIHAVGPIKTLDFLREQQSGGQQQQQSDDERPLTREELRAQVQEMVKGGLQPIYQQENVRRTDAANNLFERTVRSQASEFFKSKGLDIAQVPPDAMQFIMDATGEILKYDTEGLKELKMGGKTASVQKAFNEAMDRMDRYYVARSGWENKGKPAPGGKGGPQAAPLKKPTLDEMAEDPGLINPRYR